MIGFVPIEDFEKAECERQFKAWWEAATAVAPDHDKASKWIIHEAWWVAWEAGAKVRARIKGDR